MGDKGSLGNNLLAALQKLVDKVLLLSDLLVLVYDYIALSLLDFLLRSGQPGQHGLACAGTSPAQAAVIDTSKMIVHDYNILIIINIVAL